MLRTKERMCSTLILITLRVSFLKNEREGGGGKRIERERDLVYLRLL